MVKTDYRDNLELLRLARQGDREARDTLIEQNTPLVWSMVRRYCDSRGGKQLDHEDLFQIGCIGLIKAAEKFDPSFGVQFSTYAVPMILGEIRRFLRDDGMVKVSRSIKEMAGRILRAGQALQNSLGREPTVGEIAQELGVETEAVVEAMEAVTPWESLSGPVGGEEGRTITLEDRLPSQGGEGEMVEKIALYEVLHQLTEKEQLLVQLRYFKGRTQTETAKVLGVSQVQVSRLERKLLRKIREKLE